MDGVNRLAVCNFFWGGEGGGEGGGKVRSVKMVPAAGNCWHSVKCRRVNFILIHVFLVVFVFVFVVFA